MREIETSWLVILFVPISESLHNKPVSTHFYMSSRISRSRVSVHQWYVIKITNGLLSTYAIIIIVSLSWCIIEGVSYNVLMLGQVAWPRG